jgi:hypothetical protein
VQRRVVTVVLVAVLGLAACSDGGGDGPVAEGTSTSTPTAATVEVAPTVVPGATVVATSPTATVPPTVPEVGIPGLDSDEVVCRAWSRFAGSFQVVAVAATFGAGAAALEVVAAPSVVRAYDELLDAWPDELATERDVVADDFLGPFAARAQVARDALVDVGADDATIERIESAWLAALAERDPTSPDLAVDLDEATWSLVDAAAVTVEADLPAIPADPTLVTDASVPLTEAFLATTCPDQGTLAGQELTE